MARNHMHPDYSHDSGKAPAGARAIGERHVDSCSVHTRQRVESLRAVAVDTSYLNEQLVEKSLLSP
eukprot:3985558-Lingulodinium_polyedra.AAC.1